MFSSVRSNFASVLGSCTESPFRLRRAIEKLTFLTRHIECLISFAHSARLRPFLQYHISISTVPGQTRTVKLPESQGLWKLFLQVAAGKKLPWQLGDAGNLAETFKENVCVCSVHCECALIEHLTIKHNDSWDNVPALSYIGVSKHTCSACHIWVEAFNEVGQCTFYTRGTSGKWYWPWAMPTKEESFKVVIVREPTGEMALEKSLGETMSGKISCEYIKYLKKQRPTKRARKALRRH